MMRRWVGLVAAGAMALTVVSVPVLIAGSGTAIALPCAGATRVAASEHHSLMVRGDGTVWAWGRNGEGQLGNGTTIGSASPVQVADLTGVTTVAAGTYHSLAVRGDGTVWTWGYNLFGQLGDGTTANRTSPVQVAGLTGITTVAAGAHHSLAVRGDGTVWAWGWNGYGQLGDGTTTDRHSPVQIAGLTGVTTVAASSQHSLAVRGAGTVWAWGANGWGNLGDGTFVDRHSPVQVAGLTGVTTVAAGPYHSLAVRGDGTVWAWGAHAHGYAGNGSNSPEQVAWTVTGVTTVAAGGFHSVAVRGDGTVWAWGYNGDGQLGDGTTTDRHSPVQVVGLTGITTVAAGGYSSLALRGDGTVWAWGRNDFGQLGDGTTTNRTTPLQVDCGVAPLVSGRPGEPLRAAAVPGPGAGRVTVSWAPPATSGGETSVLYTVYRGTQPGGVKSPVGTSRDVPVFTDSGLNADTTYYYAVSASNTVGEGRRSAETSASPYAIVDGPHSTVTPNYNGQPGQTYYKVGVKVRYAGQTYGQVLEGTAAPFLDADGDFVPDEQEPVLCANENPNFNFDGTCAGSNYSPPTVAGILDDLQ